MIIKMNNLNLLFSQRFPKNPGKHTQLLEQSREFGLGTQTPLFRQ
jgi:hypothetical protein